MFSDIQSLLPKTIKRSGLGRQVLETKAIETFHGLADQLVTGDVRDSLRAMYLSGSTLMVASLSPFATEEIRKNESRIVSYINCQLGEPAVRRLGYLT